MDHTQLVILALIQGITEFLPISSSAHLILPSRLLGWPDQGLAFDVAVHLGTLVAVIAYFRKDLVLMFQDGLSRCLFAGPATVHSRQAWFLVLATLPAVFFGALASMTGFDEVVRSETVITVTTLVFGLLLGWADIAARRDHGSAEVGLRQALLIGVAQALAIIPGTSRSGITITAGLALGMTRRAASRFSFLLSVPVISAATVLMLFKLLLAPMAIDWYDMLAGAVISGISAWLCLHSFLALVSRVGFMPFVVYRVLLAGVLVTLFW